MGMSFTFQVEIEVERTEGRFASKAELAEQLLEAIEGSDPGSLYSDAGGEYEVISFEVTEVMRPPRS